MSLTVVALLLVVGSVQPADAQQIGRRQAEDVAKPENELQLRVYDVGDLVMEIKDYPYPGGDFGAIGNRVMGAAGGGGMGGGGFGGGGQFQIGGGGFGGGGVSSSDPPKISMDDVVQLLQSFVAPESWTDSGGGVGEVNIFGNSLIILQTPAIHRQIGQLLEQLRAGSGERKTVSVDARWLLLTSGELDQLVTTDESGVATLSRERLAEFTRRPTTIRGRTSCFSGQLVYVVSGTKRNVVSGYIPVVGSLEKGESAAQLAGLQGQVKFRLVAENALSRERREPNVGYQPIVEKPNVGALLEIRPTLVQGSDAAIVDLKSTVTGPVLPTGDWAAAAPPDVDRVTIQSQELATTLRVPLGEAVLVGGMTETPAELSDEEESRQLYLVLVVR